jgi:hypothetical protein
MNTEILSKQVTSWCERWCWKRVPLPSGIITLRCQITLSALPVAAGQSRFVTFALSGDFRN